MNNDSLGIKRYFLDRERLPTLFPTNRHTAEFWEHLGRAVATFGFLEEVLGKAIFAFTATRRYDSATEAENAYEAWLHQLEDALTDQLWNLAEKYGKAVHTNPDSTVHDVDELVSQIKEATKIRNILCHGSWNPPDKEGKSEPFFVNKQLEKLETSIDVEWLRSVHQHVAELACDVIDSVTQMGWSFPGTAGPGKTIWP